MPTNRRYRRRLRTVIDDELQRLHLEEGDCLLAGPGRGCTCGLRGEDGIERPEVLAEARKRLGMPPPKGG